MTRVLRLILWTALCRQKRSWVNIATGGQIWGADKLKPNSFYVDMVFNDLKQSPLTRPQFTKNVSRRKQQLFKIKLGLSFQFSLTPYFELV
jgi:hypothetical protein